jgi:hypothetical protein
MDLDEAGAQVRYLIRDRDAKFPALFDRILYDSGIETVLTGIPLLERNQQLLLDNRDYLAPIITHRFPVEDLQAGLHLFFSGRTGKVVIEQGQS